MYSENKKLTNFQYQNIYIVLLPLMYTHLPPSPHSTPLDGYGLARGWIRERDTVGYKNIRDAKSVPSTQFVEWWTRTDADDGDFPFVILSGGWNQEGRKWALNRHPITYSGSLWSGQILWYVCRPRKGIGMHVCLVDRNLYAIRGKVDTGILPRNGINDGV